MSLGFNLDTRGKVKILGRMKKFKCKSLLYRILWLSLRGAKELPGNE